MIDREKVIKAELDEIVEQCRGMDYVSFSSITEHCQNILALLKEQEDLGKALTNTVELIRKKNELIEKLLKEQKQIVRCKDCLYRKDEEARDNHSSWLPCMVIETRSDFFCADGRREENE